MTNYLLLGSTSSWLTEVVGPIRLISDAEIPNFFQVERIYATAEIAKSQVLCISSWHFNMKYEAETSLYYPCEITNQKWRLAWSNWAFKSTVISRKFNVFLLHKKPPSHSTRAFLYDSFASWRFSLSIKALKVQKIGGRYTFIRPSTKSIYCLRLGNFVYNIGNLFHATNVCFIIYSFCKTLWWLDLFVL